MIKRTTSADVAREAGVSRTTVSYVLNDTPNQQIPDQTRRKVLDAAARLEYAPSAAARALVRGHSDVIVFVLPAEATIETWTGRVLSRLSQCFAKEGFTLFTHTGRFGRERIDDVWRSITPAAVICTYIGPDEERSIKAAGVPVVLPLYGGDLGLQKITTDFQNALLEAQLRAVLDAGHSELAFVSLEGAHILTTTSRLLLLPEVTRAIGIEEPEHVVVSEDPVAAGAELQRLVDSGVTAVCAVNDHVASAVLAGARAAGIAVPSVLAVIGEGNEALGPATEPALSTVHSDPTQFAESLAKVVIRLIRKQAPPRTTPKPRIQVAHRGSV